MKNLFYIIIRVPKKESAFTYFTLEANEGLCFYSTLDFEKHQQYRDLEIQGHISFEKEMLYLLSTLQKQYPIEILKHKHISS